MANEAHLNLLKQGAEIWNQWRKEHPDIRPNLAGADLSKANLTGAVLYGANLSAAILFKADLSKANFHHADLTEATLNDAILIQTKLYEARLTEAQLIGTNLSQTFLIRTILSQANLSLANLSQAYIDQTDFHGANLYKANLSKAQIYQANFTGANLSKADLSKAVVGWVNFGDVDLSTVKGLETVKHTGPSIIGIDTIFHSKGNIPSLFLERAGVPLDIITYLEKIKVPKCRHTQEQLDDWISNLQEQSKIINKRLAHYQLQAAGYGALNVPFHIVEEIGIAEKELEETLAKIEEWQRLKDIYY